MDVSADPERSAFSHGLKLPGLAVRSPLDLCIDPHLVGAFPHQIRIVVWPYVDYGDHKVRANLTPRLSPCGEEGFAAELPPSF